MALLPGSPAIDAGNNALIPAGVTTDSAGLVTRDRRRHRGYRRLREPLPDHRHQRQLFGECIGLRPVRDHSTATISDASGLVPTGSVEFYDGSTDLGSGSILQRRGTERDIDVHHFDAWSGQSFDHGRLYRDWNFSKQRRRPRQTVNQAGTTATAASASTTFDTAGDRCPRHGGHHATGPVNEGSKPSPFSVAAIRSARPSAPLFRADPPLPAIRCPVVRQPALTRSRPSTIGPPITALPPTRAIR